MNFRITDSLARLEIALAGAANYSIAKFQSL